MLADKFDYEGHRGCRGLMPENTIPAMLKAMDIGVTTLEMDASVTKDKKIVLSHEPWFNSDITTLPGGGFITGDDRKHQIYQMNYDEVMTYDVGLKAHPKYPQQQKIAVYKPLLKDVFAAVKNYAAEKNMALPDFNIETKCTPEGDSKFHPAPAEFVKLLMDEIAAAGMSEKVIIQSFDFRTLKIVHEKYPAVRTAMLIEAFDRRSLRKQLDDLGFTPTIYSPAKEIVTANLVNDCHTRGMKVIPWTVNTKPEMQKLIKLNVDGLISDYPNLYDID